MVCIKNFDFPFIYEAFYMISRIIKISKNMCLTEVFTLKKISFGIKNKEFSIHIRFATLQGILQLKYQ